MDKDVVPPPLLEPLYYDPTLGNFAWDIMPTHYSEADTYKERPADRGTISPACTACRERHLKCDGSQPICARCMSTDQECNYVRSRRGRRPPRTKKEQSLVTMLSSQSSEEVHKRDESVVPLKSPVPSTAMTRIIQQEPSQSSSTPDKVLDLSIYNPRTQKGGSTSPPLHASSKLPELYYRYFHDAHPILIPQTHFNSFSSTLPVAVTSVIEYIGSCYSSTVDRNALRNTVETNVFSASREKSGHTVQALLLLAIAQHSVDLAIQAVQTLDSAIDLALELGLNRDSFRCACCKDSPILRESWRRTWWELYVIDGIIAAVHMKDHFRLHAHENDVALPCEESVYRAGPGPNYHRDCRYLSDMDEATFFDEEVTFSSYAYRITAVRELGNLLKLNQSFCPDSSEIVHAVDASLTNWMLHLPQSKNTPIEEDGRVDEMIFQAHTIINAALIFLHRPRSDLIFTNVQDITSCTPARRIAVPASRYSIHTAKAVAAADRIAGLITLPGHLLKHTPLFTCMITLGAVVHLSAFVITRGADQRAIIKERLSLGIGALKTMKEVWPVAESVLQRVKGAAREIISLRKSATSNMPDPHLPDMYTGGSYDVWLEGLQDPLFNEIAEMGPAGQVMQPVIYHTHA